MNKFACFSFLSVLSLAGATSMLTGCGGSGSSDPFGPDPDYETVQQRFTAPTGTVSSRNLSSLFTRYSDQRTSTGMADVSGATALGGGTATSATPGSTSTTHSQALRILDLASSSNGSSAKCSSLAAGNLTGSCTCPSGGSFDYDFSSFRGLQQGSGPIDASLKVRFDACHYSGDVGIDGREFVRVHADRTGSTLDANSLSMLIVADFTVTAGAATHTVDLAAELSKGELELALQVDDGWVTVKATSTATGTGSFVIRDRNGSWTCDVANGAGSCRDSKGNSQKF